MPLPVSCFALTGDDCSVLWVSSLGPAPLLDRKPPPESVESHRHSPAPPPVATGAAAAIQEERGNEGEGKPD